MDREYMKKSAHAKETLSVVAKNKAVLPKDTEILEDSRVDIYKYSNSDDPIIECEKRGGVELYAHPFYEWVENNIETIKLPLIKAIIGNLTPLDKKGRIYFEFIASLRAGFTDELIAIYNSEEKKYKEGRLKPLPYWVMYELGYTGQVMNRDCPVYDVLELINSPYVKKV